MFPKSKAATGKRKFKTILWAAQGFYYRKEQNTECTDTKEQKESEVVCYVGSVWERSLGKKTYNKVDGWVGEIGVIVKIDIVKVETINAHGIIYIYLNIYQIGGLKVNDGKNWSWKNLQKS